MAISFVLTALMGAIAVGWVVILAWNVVKMRRMPHARRADAAHFPSDAPLVSVLVPARNEESRIVREALRSIARQDYPNLEVIAVDDRSTDRTLALLEEVAREEPRVRGVRGGPLPAGWLGKPWALEQAKRVASGTWILATDADILFAPEAVRSAMTVAFRGRYDAVTLVPDVSGSPSFWVRAVMPVAAWMIAVVFPPEKTNDPASSVALGCGAFLLMRREAHDAAGGYDAIKAEVADDVATARALKAAGRRLRLENGVDLLHTPMYGSFRELWDGFSKNAFSGADRQLSVVARNSVANLLTTALPLAVAFAGLGLWLGAGVEAARPPAVAAILAAVATVAAFAPVYSAFGEGARYALAAAPANVIMVLILLNSAYKAISGRGVQWRGDRVGTKQEAQAGWAPVAGSPSPERSGEQEI
jgi:glycosyltransferase involved in cell wall biosynthesis